MSMRMRNVQSTIFFDSAYCRGKCREAAMKDEAPSILFDIRHTIVIIYLCDDGLGMDERDCFSLT